VVQDTKNKEANKDQLSDSSLHSEEIKENLADVNMDAWFYIYENYVNPDLKKNNQK